MKLLLFENRWEDTEEQRILLAEYPKSDGMQCGDTYQGGIIGRWRCTRPLHAGDNIHVGHAAIQTTGTTARLLGRQCVVAVWEEVPDDAAVEAQEVPTEAEVPVV